MSETKNNVVESAQNTTKKARRGVSNKTQAVAQLKFHEKDAAQNGLFVGHLESVSVEWFTDANGKEFEGNVEVAEGAHILNAVFKNPLVVK